MNYDLEERTTRFSENVIYLIGKYRKDTLLFPILSQLIRSATSIGANYCEANGASSKKDFTNKIHICKKEAKETQYWLRILASMSSEKPSQYEEIKREARELTLIFSKIAANSKNNIK